MLPVKFGSIWPSSFRGEDFFKQQDLTTLKFLRKSDYLSWELLPFFHQNFNTFCFVFQKL
jgi:hypothetical protein